MKKRFIAGVLALLMTSTAAYAYVTPGDLNRLRGLAMTMTSATITTLTATTATITTFILGATTVTASGTELNYSDVATLGTLAASKVWTSDASLDTVMPTGGLLTVQSGGAATFNSGSTLTVAGTLATTGAVTATGAVASTRTTSADSATTNSAFAVALTAPVDTTGTNSHLGFNFTPTIGNATGGTNTVTGYNVANVTGDAEVNVNGLKCGTGTTLGTSNCITVGTGWDAGLDTGSPIITTSTITGDGGDALFGFKQDQVASTTTAVTIAQCGKTFVSNSADVMTLPEASTVIGCRYTFISGTNDDFDINPQDSPDIIAHVVAVAGTITPSAGDAIRITDIGASVTVEAIGADTWAVIAFNGAVTDVN